MLSTHTHSVPPTALPLIDGEATLQPLAIWTEERAAHARKVLASALKFSIDDIVWRYCRDYKISPENGLIHERELKKFLVLVGLNPAYDYGMYGPIDHIWHVFIMFTKNYAAFCDLISGRFLHHIPGGVDDGHLSRSNYNQLLADYAFVFQTSPPEDCWPRISSHGVGSNCTGGACSACTGGCSGGCSAIG